MNTTPTTPTPNLTDIIRRAQEVVFATLPPDSQVTQEQAISKLLSLLDGPETRLALAKHAHAKAFIEWAADQLNEQVANQEPKAPADNQAAVWEQAENAAATIQRLREQLDRTRASESHLIKSRDELIQKLRAAEKKLETVQLALR